jgi:hypothetical protein
MADDGLLILSRDAACILSSSEQMQDDSDVAEAVLRGGGASLAGSPLVAALAQAVIDAHAKAALDDFEEEARAEAPATTQPQESHGLILIHGGRTEEGDS